MRKSITATFCFSVGIPFFQFGVTFDILISFLYRDIILKNAGDLMPLLYQKER